MSISEHSNGIASTIDFNCNKKKQDKRLSNHHFPLHLPQQTKRHSCEPRYAALIWYSINFQWVFGMQLIGCGGGGGQQSSWKSTQRRTQQSIIWWMVCSNRQIKNISFYWPYMIVSMIWNSSKLSASHLSRATAIFVVDCWKFGPSLMFGLKMELMSCADMVGGTTEQSCLFPDLIW